MFVEILHMTNGDNILERLEIFSTKYEIFQFTLPIINLNVFYGQNETNFRELPVCAIRPQSSMGAQFTNFARNVKHLQFMKGDYRQNSICHFDIQFDPIIQLYSNTL
jgi:hypothetical protein